MTAFNPGKNVEVGNFVFNKVEFSIDKPGALIIGREPANESEGLPVLRYNLGCEPIRVEIPFDDSHIQVSRHQLLLGIIPAHHERASAGVSSAYPDTPPLLTVTNIGKNRPHVYNIEIQNEQVNLTIPYRYTFRRDEQRVKVINTPIITGGGESNVDIADLVMRLYLTESPIHPVMQPLLVMQTMLGIGIACIIIVPVLNGDKLSIFTHSFLHKLNPSPSEETFATRTKDVQISEYIKNSGLRGIIMNLMKPHEVEPEDQYGTRPAGF